MCLLTFALTKKMKCQLLLSAWAPIRIKTQCLFFVLLILLHKSHFFNKPASCAIQRHDCCFPLLMGTETSASAPTLHDERNFKVLSRSEGMKRETWLFHLPSWTGMQFPVVISVLYWSGVCTEPKQVLIMMAIFYSWSCTGYIMNFY